MRSTDDQRSCLSEDFCLWGLYFSRSELLRHVWGLMEADDTREMGCDCQSEALEYRVRTGGVQGTREGFGSE